MANVGQEIDEETTSQEDVDKVDLSITQKELLLSRSESKKHVQQIEQEIIQENKRKAAMMMQKNNQVSIETANFAMSKNEDSLRESKPFMQHSGGELETKAETILMNERQFDCSQSGMISDQLTENIGSKQTMANPHHQMLERQLN